MEKMIPILGLRKFEDLETTNVEDFMPIWKKDDYIFVSSDPVNEETTVGDLVGYAKSIYEYMINGTPMETIFIYCNGELIKGVLSDQYSNISHYITRRDLQTANVFSLMCYIEHSFASDSDDSDLCSDLHEDWSLLDCIEWMGLSSDYKNDKRFEAEFITNCIKLSAWTLYPDFKIDGHSCPEMYRAKIEELSKEEDKSKEPKESKPKKNKKTEETVVDVNPDELKPDDEPEEKKIETPNAAPVVICLPMRDDSVEVNIPKTPPVKSGPEAATPDSVELDPPKTVEAKVTEPRVTNVQNMTIVENTDGYHLYSQDIAYDASVMYGAEITNCPKPPADKIIAQNRATLREYFLKRGLVRKTKKGYMLKHINFDKKKTEKLDLNDVLSRAQALQDQLRKISKQCEIYITPREFLMSTAEDEATVNAIDIYRKYYNLNMKDPASMIPYLDKGVPNNYVIDIVCYDDAGAVFKPYCITIDFLGCIEKYRIVDGQKVEGDRIPQIYVGASLIFDGEEISNLYFGKEKENNCIIMKVPCTLNNIDSLFRQIGRGYYDSIEEDYPLMKDAKAPEREKELKQKAVVSKKLAEQINNISAQISEQKKATIGQLQRQQLPEIVTSYYRH